MSNFVCHVRPCPTRTTYKKMRVEIKLESFFFLYNCATMEFADKQNGKDMKPPVKIAKLIGIPYHYVLYTFYFSLWVKIAQH